MFDSKVPRSIGTIGRVFLTALSAFLILNFGQDVGNDLLLTGAFVILAMMILATLWKGLLRVFAFLASTPECLTDTTTSRNHIDIGDLSFAKKAIGVRHQLPLILTIPLMFALAPFASPRYQEAPQGAADQSLLIFGVTAAILVFTTLIMRRHAQLSRKYHAVLTLTISSMSLFFLIFFSYYYLLEARNEALVATGAITVFLVTWSSTIRHSLLLLLPFKKVYKEFENKDVKEHINRWRLISATTAPLSTFFAISYYLGKYRDFNLNSLGLLALIVSLIIIMTIFHYLLSRTSRNITNVTYIAISILAFAFGMIIVFSAIIAILIDHGTSYWDYSIYVIGGSVALTAAFNAIMRFAVIMFGIDRHCSLKAMLRIHDDNEASKQQSTVLKRRSAYKVVDAIIGTPFVVSLAFGGIFLFVAFLTELMSGGIFDLLISGKLRPAYERVLLLEIFGDQELSWSSLGKSSALGAGAASCFWILAFSLRRLESFRYEQIVDGFVASFQTSSRPDALLLRNSEDDYLPVADRILSPARAVLAFDNRYYSLRELICDYFVTTSEVSLIQSRKTKGLGGKAFASLGDDWLSQVEVSLPFVRAIIVIADDPKRRSEALAEEVSLLADSESLRKTVFVVGGRGRSVKRRINWALEVLQRGDLVFTYRTVIVYAQKMFW